MPSSINYPPPPTLLPSLSSLPCLSSWSGVWFNLWCRGCHLKAKHTVRRHFTKSRQLGFSSRVLRNVFWAMPLSIIPFYVLSFCCLLFVWYLEVLRLCEIPSSVTPFCLLAWCLFMSCLSVVCFLCDTFLNLWIPRSIRNKLLWALRYASVSLRCRHRVCTVLKSPWILGEVLEKSLNSIFPWKVVEFSPTLNVLMLFAWPRENINHSSENLKVIYIKYSMFCAIINYQFETSGLKNVEKLAKQTVQALKSY